MSAIKSILLCLVSSMFVFSTACPPIGEQFQFPAEFPIEKLPLESSMKKPIDVLEFVGIASNQNGENVKTSNEIPEEITGDPNSLLQNVECSVYFDNTNSAFYEYTVDYDNDDECDRQFTDLMKALRSSFSSMRSYTPHILQKDETNPNLLVWNAQEGEYSSNNIFGQFIDSTHYTHGSGGNFETAPICMWTDELQNMGDISNKLSVYISDCNEQNNLLPEAGTQLRNLLINAGPDGQNDVLIISFKMKFVGKISLPMYEGEGNAGTGTGTDGEHTFTEPIERNYYLVAYGEREVLAAFSADVKNQMQAADFDLEEFMYHNWLYTTEELLVKDMKNGEELEKDYLKNNPVAFHVTDINGSTFDSGEAAQEVLSADRPLKNLLELCGNDVLSNYFKESPQGTNYLFRSLGRKEGNPNSEALFELTSDDYTLKTDDVEIYVYSRSNPEKASDTSDAAEESQEWEWLRKTSDEMKDYAVSVEYTEKTVKVALDKPLDSNVGSTPALLVSIPIEFTYEHIENVERKNIVDIPVAFVSDVAEKTMPIDATREDADAYGKTYEYDDFIDNLTGYQALSPIDQDGDGQLEHWRATVIEPDKLNEPETITATVDRLNILIVSTETEYN